MKFAQRFPVNLLAAIPVVVILTGLLPEAPTGGDESTTWGALARLDPFSRNADLGVVLFWIFATAIVVGLFTATEPSSGSES